ncbi:MAG: hypothetical protein ED556_06055 [Winogradskyella sp.]|uniref:hypothetical protein n=1 Tax=Winogradskyella sp. TaxID=1883156 RepID=UPI000F403E7C|nr:hypothetical protein [Winogradskyella sp.]RNC86984.1 MAG: hypothetical protein ED556_06055 [Winogradskyella sp.]
MKTFKYIIGIALVTLSYNCTSVSEEDLIDNTPPPDFVNFEEDIRVIFENNCWQCHGTTPQFGAQTSLVFYDEVVFGIENNNVIGRISLQPGEPGAMPLTGVRLPQNLIDLIILWEEEGFLESP